ncbi:hypothetical protein FNX48_024680, partial [Streptomyces sp. IF17]|nr:hypothetical protein [Streptomyces alkaliphilus]
MDRETSCTACGGSAGGDEGAVCGCRAGRPAEAPAGAAPTPAAEDPRTLVIRPVAVIASGSPSGMPRERLTRPVRQPDRGPNPGDVAMFTETAPLPRVVPGELVPERLAAGAPDREAPESGALELRGSAPLVYA